MKKNPSVSIIIPAYNRAWALDYCITSAREQIHDDIEIICIDDASTDNSLELLQKHASADSRIKVIHNEKNLGAAASRNIGLKAAAGKYVYFLDSDDILETYAMQLIVSRLEQHDADICLSKMMLRNLENDTIKISDACLDINAIGAHDTFNIDTEGIDFFKVTYLGLQNKTFRRQFLIDNSIQFQDITSTNNVLFSFKALVLAKKITYTSVATVEFVQHKNGRILDLKKDNWQNALIAYRSVFEFFKTVKSEDAYDYISFYCNCLMHRLYYNFLLIQNADEKSSYCKKMLEVFGSKLPIAAMTSQPFYQAMLNCIYGNRKTDNINIDQLIDNMISE